MKKPSFFFFGLVQFFIFALPMMAHCLTNNTLYRELNDTVFLMLPMFLACILVVLQLILMKACYPTLYADYLKWTSKGIHEYFGLPLIFIGYFLFIFVILEYCDQYGVTTPVNAYEFTAYSHYIHYGRRGRKSYYTVFISPVFGKYEISGQKYYNTVGKGDSLTLNLREGRFHSYFVVDEKLNKFIPSPYQNFLTEYNHKLNVGIQDYNANLH
jgi:hypothetical protein